MSEWSRFVGAEQRGRSTKIRDTGGKKRVTLEGLDARVAGLEALVEELKAMIAERGPTPEQEEQLRISEYYAAEAAERRDKREARARADAETERQRLEDRVLDLERFGWGR